VIRDITEQKHAEEALRNFSARLIGAQEEERARLARELHDDITQRLARLAIDVGRSEVGMPAPPLDETGRSVREELIRLSEDVHALSYRLHPSILEDLGLAAALKAEAERFERQRASAIELKVEALPDSVSSDAALCLFRVAQEALRNAARHSGRAGDEAFVAGPGWGAAVGGPGRRLRFRSCGSTRPSESWPLEHAGAGAFGGGRTRD
jgi:signal transduction histidine kinase